MAKFEVEFYQNEKGQEPAKDFLLSLDKKMRAKTFEMIVLLQDNGNELRMPYSRYLSGGIFELRSKVGTDISRVLYFFYIGNRIILTNGFTKKTQKTPRAELEKARKIKSNFLKMERIKDNGNKI